MHLLLKSLSRCGEYYRGLKLYFLINSCGGKCKSIPRVGKSVIFKYPPHKNITIGKKCYIGSSVEFDIPKTGHFKLGDYAKLTNNINISAANFIEIGDNALIAEGVSIRDSQHEYSKRSVLIRNQGLEEGEIRIGSDVWLGKGCTILLNSYIGTGCVIGANSLVKDIKLENYGVYVGTPIRKIKTRD